MGTLPTEEVAINNSNVFSFFVALPQELREMVWVEFLRESTPLVYRFRFRYNQRSRVRYTEGYIYDIYHYEPEPDDTVFLEPAEYHHSHKSLEWREFVRSTSASRATLGTCQESRRIALKLLPHSLAIRELPWDWTIADKRKDAPADGSGYPEYTLRFNGAKDIFIFHYAMWEDQEAVVKISERSGRVPDAFLDMAHVGIGIRSFARGHRLAGGGHHGGYGVSETKCDCSTDVCRDACQYEPLPRFLSCFPSLKTFYIARVSDRCDDEGDEIDGKATALENADCHCGPSEGGGETSEPRHNWSIIKSSDVDRWCVIWDERTGCIPVHPIVKLLRGYWRPNFPYYKEMDHLDIRFIRRLDPGGISE